MNEFEFGAAFSKEILDNSNIAFPRFITKWSFKNAITLLPDKIFRKTKLFQNA